MGAIHALTISPTSSAVLEIVGAVFVAAFSFLLLQRDQQSDRREFRRIAPILGASIILLLVGYWFAWGGVKAMRYIATKPPSEIGDFTSIEQTQAMSIILFLDGRGIRRDLSVPLVVDLRESNRCVASSQVEGRATTTIALDIFANACGISEFADLANSTDSLSKKPKLNFVDEQRFVTSHAAAVTMIKQLGAAGGVDLTGQKNCTLDQSSLVELMKFDDLRSSCGSTLETFEANILSQADAVSAPPFIRNESGRK